MDRPVVSREMIDLYDEYTHLTLDRRGFMERLTAVAGSAAAAGAALSLLEADSAAAAVVAADDARLETSAVMFAGAGGDISGYLARPKDATGKLPAVMVIHENRGLNPHIEDVVRRTALEGFLALGPDFLSPSGGTPDDGDAAREMIRALDPATTLEDAMAARNWLSAHAAGTGKTGAVGFCWGGGTVNRLAVADAGLDAGVAFYGRVPDPDTVANIEARLMLHYAGLDERINAGIPDYKSALDAAGVDYTIHMYEGVNHAFHNDTSAARYDRQAAEVAWQRTVSFLKDALA